MRDVIVYAQRNVYETIVLITKKGGRQFEMQTELCLTDFATD